MSKEACISFIKNNISKLEYNLINSAQKNTGRTRLRFEVDMSKHAKFCSNLPMIIEPRKWEMNKTKTNAIKGGYLYNYNDIIQLKYNNIQLNNNKITFSQRYIDLINKLQRIKYTTKCLEQAFKEHSITYNENLLKLNNMKQDTKYDKKLYYMFKSEFVEPLELLLVTYKDFIQIMNAYKLSHFYLLFKVCFRGRVYASGLISPTSDKVLRKYITPYGYTSNSKVIEMDATASVLQILATISCSIKLAKITNLMSEEPINTWSSMHNEIINTDKDKQQEILNTYFSNNKNVKRFNIDDIYDTIDIIDRGIVKFTIMRILYGSNPYQISKDIKAEYDIPKLSYKHILLIYASFSYHYNEEINVLNIIKLINTNLMKVKESVIYVNNYFIIFENTYYKKIKESIKFEDRNNKIREVEITIVDKTRLDKRKSTNASFLNLFHSINSGVCLSIIETFLNKNKFLLTTHDAFIIYESDSTLLLKEYNKELFNNHSKIINLIEDNY
jgi:hypothetical protein